MKITKIEPILLAIPFEHGAPKPPSPTGGVRENMDALYLKVETDEGLIGWGECFGFAGCPITHAAVMKGVAPAAVGRDATDISALMQDLYKRFQNLGHNGPVGFALSGLDIALWDIAGKAKGVPIHRLLGSDGTRTRVATYASLIRIGTPAHIENVCRTVLSRGYRQIKLHERTIDAVAAARHVVGDAYPLMLDTNCTWTPRQAVEMAGAMEPYNLTWLEEPIFPADDYTALAALRAAAPMPIAAGENLGNLNDVRRMLDAGAVDIVQPDPIKMGGITECWKALQLADTRGVQAEPHSPYYGPGLVAALHMLAAMKSEAMCEFYYADLRHSPLGDVIYPAGGFLDIPQGPGLGIEVDEQVIARYRIA